MFAKIAVIAACLFGFVRAGGLYSSALGYGSNLGYSDHGSGVGYGGYGSGLGSYGGYSGYGGYGGYSGYGGYGGYGSGLGHGGYNGYLGSGLGHATSHVSVVKGIAPSYAGYSSLGYGSPATSYVNQYSVHSSPALSGYGAYGAGQGGYGGYGHGAYGHGAYGHGAYGGSGYGHGAYGGW